MHPEKREEWNFRKIENIKELENIFPKDRNKTFFQNTLEGGGDDSVQKGQQPNIKLSKHTDTTEFHFVKRSEMGIAQWKPRAQRSQVKLG